MLDCARCPAAVWVIFTSGQVTIDEHFLFPPVRGPAITHLFSFSCSQGWYWNDPQALYVYKLGIRSRIRICLMMRIHFLWQSCFFYGWVLFVCLLFSLIKDFLWNFSRLILFLFPCCTFLIYELCLLFHVSSPRMLRFQDKIFGLEPGDLEFWIGIWEDAMCPGYVTRKFCICLFGIGQTNNTVYFNFPFAVAPCIYNPFGYFKGRSCEIRAVFRCSPPPIPRRRPCNITNILSLFLKHHLPFKDVVICVFSWSVVSSSLQPHGL